jgi:hypothetical protein
MDSVLESLVAGYLCLALQEALKKHTQKHLKLKGNAAFASCKITLGYLDLKVFSGHFNWVLRL